MGIFYCSVFLLSSCARQRMSPQELSLRLKEHGEPANITDARTQVLKHPLYQCVPRHRTQFSFFDLPRTTAWAFLGNDDDGLFGEEESLRENTVNTYSYFDALYWFLRNPFHNFTFYVIGTRSEKKQEAFVLLMVSSERLQFMEYEPSGGHIFPSRASSIYLALHRFKPFISLRLNYIFTKRRMDFYFGWRSRGDFGIKWLPWRKQSK